ncbi:MAG: hypothetical protein KGH79_03775 [Patescibacteria group bacterium]|nr:hypothetical protein [Patescibacteria group bacterium]
MDDSSLEPQRSESPSQVGPVVAIIIIVILIALGGLYFLISKEMQRTPPTGQEQANS